MSKKSKRPSPPGSPCGRPAAVEDGGTAPVPRSPRAASGRVGSPAPLISTVTARGQTTIPTELRRRFELAANTRLEWLDDGEMMLVIPVPSDPIEQFRGKARATLTLNLLRDRKVLRSREG